MVGTRACQIPIIFQHFLNTLWFMLCYSLNIEIGSHFSFASGGAVYRHFNMHSLWLDCTIKHNSTEIWPHFPHEISPYYTRTNSKVFAPCMLNIYGQLEHVLYLKLALLFKNKIRWRSKPKDRMKFKSSFIVKFDLPSVFAIIIYRNTLIVCIEILDIIYEFQSLPFQCGGTHSENTWCNHFVLSQDPNKFSL